MLNNRLIALLLLSLTGTGVQAADLIDARAPGVIAALEKNGVNIGGLKIAPTMGGPMINLGTGRDGGEANNANDENLALVAQLPQLERLFLFRGKFTKAGLRQLAALPNLRSLQIYAPSEVRPEVFAILPELTKLQAISFGDYPVNDEMLGYMEKLPGLKALEITKAENVSPAAMARFLASVDDLENLLLLEGDAIDDEGLKLLGEKKNMKRLVLDSQKITPAAWGSLAGLTNMRDLRLRGTSFDDEGMHALEGMIDLEVLILGKTQITDAGLASLSDLTKLQDLGLDGTRITDAGMSDLKDLTELKNLYVSQTKVTAKGLAVVPRKDRMVMMSAGQEPLSSKQFVELTELFPGTQIFDPAGYWRPERIQAAMKELGKN